MLKDIKKTTKHTSIYALGNLATKVIGLILIPLYTNSDYLSHDDYGALAVLEATSQLLVGLLAMSMTAGLGRWYWDKAYRGQQKSIFFTTIAFLLCCIIPISTTLVSIAEHLSIWLYDNKSFTYLLKLTILAASTQVIVNQILALLRLQSKSLLYIIVQIIKLSTILGLILWGILVQNRGLNAIWEATLAGELLSLIILLPFTFKNIHFKIHLKILKDMISYGLPLMLASVSGVLLATADRYMLSSMSGLEKTGIYSVGLRIANTLKIVITTSLMNAILPIKMKKINANNNQRFFSKVNTYTIFIFTFSMIGLSLFALEGIKLFTGSKIYWQANGIVPLISVALLFGLMRGNTQIGLVIKKKTKAIGILLVSTSLLNIGLNLLLIPIFDIYGAALATLLSQLFFFITTTTSAQKHYHIPYEWSKIVTAIIIAIIIISIGLLTAELNLPIRLLIKLALFVSFPFILYFFNFYEKIEIENIKRIIYNWKKPKNLRENIRQIIKEG